MGQPTLVDILRAADADVPEALIDVVAEFELQRQKWGPSHDDGHTDGALAVGASFMCATMDAPAFGPVPAWVQALAHRHRNDRRRQLVVGVTLGLSELARLDRAAGRG